MKEDVGEGVVGEGVVVGVLVLVSVGMGVWVGVNTCVAEAVGLEGIGVGDRVIVGNKGDVGVLDAVGVPVGGIGAVFVGFDVDVAGLGVFVGDMIGVDVGTFGTQILCPSRIRVLLPRQLAN